MQHITIGYSRTIARDREKSETFTAEASVEQHADVAAAFATLKTTVQDAIARAGQRHSSIQYDHPNDEHGH
jgi:hypothetical protein